MYTEILLRLLKQIRLVKTQKHATPSPLTRILRRGRSKVVVTDNTRNLLPVMANNDHQNIARLIAKWLEQEQGQNKT